MIFMHPKPFIGIKIILILFVALISGVNPLVATAVIVSYASVYSAAEAF